MLKFAALISALRTFPRSAWERGQLRNSYNNKSIRGISALIRIIF